MATMDSTFNRFSSSKFDLNALLKTQGISARTQRHLARVYATLTGGIVVAALGAAIDTRIHFGGFLTTIGAIGESNCSRPCLHLLKVHWVFPAILSSVCLLGLLTQSNAPKSTQLSFFGGFTFLKGMSLGKSRIQLIVYSPHANFHSRPIDFNGVGN